MEPFSRRAFLVDGLSGEFGQTARSFSMPSPPTQLLSPSPHVSFTAARGGASPMRQALLQSPPVHRTKDGLPSVYGRPKSRTINGQTLDVPKSRAPSLTLEERIAINVCWFCMVSSRSSRHVKLDVHRDVLTWQHILQAAAEVLGPGNYSKPNLKQAMRQMDLNGNGEIDYKEFKGYMSTNSSAHMKAETVLGVHHARQEDSLIVGGDMTLAELIHAYKRRWVMDAVIAVGNRAASGLQADLVRAVNPEIPNAAARTAGLHGVGGGSLSGSGGLRPSIQSNMAGASGPGAGSASEHHANMAKEVAQLIGLPMRQAMAGVNSPERASPPRLSPEVSRSSLGGGKGDGSALNTSRGTEREWLPASLQPMAPASLGSLSEPPTSLTTPSSRSNSQSQLLMNRISLPQVPGGSASSLTGATAAAGGGGGEESGATAAMPPAVVASTSSPSPEPPDSLQPAWPTPRRPTTSQFSLASVSENVWGNMSWYSLSGDQSGSAVASPFRTGGGGIPWMQAGSSKPPAQAAPPSYARASIPATPSYADPLLSHIYARARRQRVMQGAAAATAAAAASSAAAAAAAAAAAEASHGELASSSSSSLPGMGSGFPSPRGPPAAPGNVVEGNFITRHREEAQEKPLHHSSSLISRLKAMTGQRRAGSMPRRQNSTGLPSHAEGGGRSAGGMARASTSHQEGSTKA